MKGSEMKSSFSGDMRRRMRSGITVFSCALGMLGVLGAMAPAAQAVPAEPVKVAISGCWIRALPGNLPAGGYFIVTNSGDATVDLVNVKSHAYGMVMMHRTVTSGNTTKMVMIDRASVRADGVLTFKPGSYHLMLEKPRRPLADGALVPMTFTFSDGEAVTTQCTVRHVGANAQ